MAHWTPETTRWHAWRSPFQDEKTGRWYVRRRVLLTGKVEAILLKATGKTAARNEVKLLAAEDESRYEDTGEAPLPTSALSVEAALTAWLKTKDVRPITLRFYEQDCRNYARLLGKDRDVSMLQPIDIRTMLDGWTTPTGKPKALSGRSKQKHRQALAEFFGWLIREAKVMRHNPAVEMKEPAAWGKAVRKAQVATRRPLTDDEAARLVAAAEGDMRTFLMVGIHCGVRLSNLIGSPDKRPIQWGDFRDLWKPGHERLYLPSDVMKWDSPSPFDVPIHEELAEYLRSRARETRKLPDAGEAVIKLERKTLRAEWPELLKKAQIEGKRTPHDLRATAITLWDLHCSVSVSYALEHHSPVGNVRAGYTKPTHEKIREQLARVPRLLGRKRTAAAAE